MILLIQILNSQIVYIKPIGLALPLQDLLLLCNKSQFSVKSEDILLLLELGLLEHY